MRARASPVVLTTALTNCSPTNTTSWLLSGPDTIFSEQIGPRKGVGVVGTGGKGGITGSVSVGGSVGIVVEGNPVSGGFPSITLSRIRTRVSANTVFSVKWIHEAVLCWHRSTARS